jgi:hypothetical protein
VGMGACCAMRAPVVRSVAVRRCVRMESSMTNHNNGKVDRR